MKDSEGNNVTIGDVLINKEYPNGGIPLVFEEIHKKMIRLRMERHYKKENPLLGTSFLISQEDFSVSGYVKRKAS
ncbi:hypothetical protein LCGC14_2674840 [marine sediment metagenome]|uniref:Uncharacterized protein n=1 Tax=marine sediment metagenome TaxID=412755 RepID=A0A0F9AAJ5_9ZZZZ